MPARKTQTMVSGTGQKSGPKAPFTSAHKRPFVALKNLRAALRSLGTAELNVRQLDAFLLIALHPGMTGNEIAEALGIDQSAASRIATNILGVYGRGNKKGLGWTTLGTEPGDRRVKPILLSPKGEKVVERLAEALL